MNRSNSAYNIRLALVNFIRHLAFSDAIVVITLIISSLVLVITVIIDNSAIQTSAIVSILVIIIGDRLTSIASRQEDKKVLERIDNSLHEVAMCIHMGSPSEAIDYFISKMDTARSVWNTFVIFGEEGNDRAALYGKSKADSIRKAIVQFVATDGKRWTDVFANNSEEFAKDFKHRVGNDIAGIYHCGLLRSDFPIINFAIIQYSVYGDESSEVLFGWGNHNKDRVGNVFLSRNPKVVNTFFRYYEVLMENCDWISLKDAAPSPPGSASAGEQEPIGH